ncbi:hypothetical protein C2W62_35720 [Candidatus Entotheonella serta]|nr:hypothetical protein C2W62_35720 [Candidatus Entotheonella serta]
MGNNSIIRQGRVDIVVHDGAVSRVVNTLGEGEFFGEAALLTGEPRNATVRASEPVVLYSLDKVHFQAAVADSSSLREQLMNILFQRQ